MSSLVSGTGCPTHADGPRGSEVTSAEPTVVTDHRELPSREVALSKIADGLDAPWAFAWLPNGDVLVTERFGALRIIEDGALRAEPLAGVPEVFASGQGGLLDVALHPDFEDNRTVYLSYAHGTEEGNRLRIARAELNGMALEGLEVIFEVAQTKTGGQHFGSRFQWIPDGTLLLSVGDGGNPPREYDGKPIREQAQSLGAHLGKILRINDDGSIPQDNPFVGRPDARPEIWSFGHRNVQGLTYDADRGRVFASEHGSKGGDELNLVMPGESYGWPLATHSTEYDAWGTSISSRRSLPGAQDPLAVWTPSIAPSDLVHYTGERYGDWKGDLFLAAMLLRDNESIVAYASRPPGAVLRIEMDGEGRVSTRERLDVGDVRVRDVDQGPDGFLYVLTDATSRQSRAGENAGALWRIEPP